MGSSAGLARRDMEIVRLPTGATNIFFFLLSYLYFFDVSITNFV